MLKLTRRDLAAISLLALLNVLVFVRLWTVVAGKPPLALIPWDFRSIFAPQLVFIGDCLQAGFLPLWNPYNAGGTPFFIYPQSQMYAPTTLLIGTLFGYTVRAAQVQLLGTVLFGGIGAYLLSRSLWDSRWAGLITGIAFQFTTAIFGNFQHMTIVNCDVLIPWLLLALRLSAQSPTSAARYLFALFLFLLISTGYPGVELMVLAWCGVYAVYLYVHDRKPGLERRTFLRHQIEGWLLGMGFAAVIWLPVVIHRSDFTRGAALGIDYVLSPERSLSFKHLWGTLFHFMTLHGLPGVDVDISMRGVYFGIVAFALAITAVIWGRSERVVPAVVLAAGGFLMSCGGSFFGRVAVHVFMPLFNFSRFPSGDSRALAVLGASLLAGGGASLVAQSHPEARGTLRRVLLGFIGVLAFGLLIWRGLVDTTTYTDVVLAYVSLELAILGAAMLACHRLPPRQTLGVLGILLALEVGTGVLANHPVSGHDISASEWKAYVGLHNPNFTPERARTPRLEIPGDPTHTAETPEAYLAKSFYVGDYTFRLGRFDTLVEGGFMEWLRDGARMVAIPPNTDPGPSFPKLSGLMYPVEHQIIEYFPNRVVYTVKLSEESLLVFNEVFFPGWRARVDSGAEQSMLEVAGGLRALRVPEGEHRIETRFRPRSFFVGLAVSGLAWLYVGARLVIALTARRRSRSAVQVSPNG